MAIFTKKTGIYGFRKDTLKQETKTAIFVVGALAAYDTLKAGWYLFTSPASPAPAPAPADKTNKA